MSVIETLSDVTHIVALCGWSEFPRVPLVAEDVFRGVRLNSKTSGIFHRSIGEGPGRAAVERITVPQLKL